MSAYSRCTLHAESDWRVSMRLLQDLSKTRVFEVKCLCERSASVLIANRLVGARGEECLRRRRLAEVDRRRIHERRVAVFVDRVDVHACGRKQWNDVRA